MYKGIKICDAVEKISSGKIVLPDIQREFVWNRKKRNQIETLFDSIMREYPIATFLFWNVAEDQRTEFTFYRFIDEYYRDDETRNHNKRANLNGINEPIAVLDGQQRLTSIYLGLKGKYYTGRKEKPDTRVLFINLVKNLSGDGINNKEDDEEKFEFRFLTAKESKNDAEHYWYEVGHILDYRDYDETESKIEMGKYIDNNLTNYTSGQQFNARVIMEQLSKVINEKDDVIWYFEDVNKDIEKVMQVFVRVNRGGTPLSYSDLLLSMITSQETQFREKINDLVDDIKGKGYRIDKDFVLKSVMVLLELDDIRFSSINNFNKANINKMLSAWEHVSASILWTFDFLKSIGITGDVIKSDLSIIPIAYYVHKTQKKKYKFEASQEDKEQIKNYLVRTIVKKVFSSGTDSVLNTLRGVIKSEYEICKLKQGFPLDAIVNAMDASGKALSFNKEDIEDLLDLKYRSANTLPMLLLIFQSTTEEKHYDKDHIYPKSKFTAEIKSKYAISEEEINSIANIQVLWDEQNREEKKAMLFNEWLQKNYPDKSTKGLYLASRSIPEWDNYEFADFKTFLKERREILRGRFSELLGV